jgi:hypothetical protein
MAWLAGGGGAVDLGGCRRSGPAWQAGYVAKIDAPDVAADLMVALQSNDQRETEAILYRLRT